MKTKRNGNIELLRFCFCMFIVFLHFKDNIKSGLFLSGYLGVDFFFMLSGLFMAKKLRKDKAAHSKETIQLTLAESRKYLLSRVASIYPYYLVAVLIFAFIRFYDSDVVLADGLSLVVSDLLFLQIFGYKSWSFTGTMWFLCALFTAIFILYPIVRRYYDIYVKYLASFIAVLFIGFILRTKGTISVAIDFAGNFLSYGVLRAIAMMSLGMVVCELSEKAKNIAFLHRTAPRLLLTLAEISCWALTFLYMLNIKGKTEFVAIGFITIGLTITVSGISFLYGKFDNAFVGFLGKSSMIIFMTHHYWTKNIELCFSLYGLEGNKITLICAALGISFITAAIVWFFGNVIKAVCKRIKKEITA